VTGTALVEGTLPYTTEEKALVVEALDNAIVAMNYTLASRFQAAGATLRVGDVIGDCVEFLEQEKRLLK
jgi:hypothetical protein